MRHANESIIKSILSVLMIISGLTGCFGGSANKIATKYYLIDPVESEALKITSAQPLSIEIIDVHLPQYLQRFHIATRVGENRLKFSEANQWGENLRKNLMRTLSRNLSRSLATQDISTPLKRSSSLSDYRIQVYIEQFELDIDHKVKLSARWQISGNDSLEPLGIYSEDAVSQIMQAGDYAQMVSFMQQLYGQLSSKIAQSIVTEVNK